MKDKNIFSVGSGVSDNGEFKIDKEILDKVLKNVFQGGIVVTNDPNVDLTTVGLVTCTGIFAIGSNGAENGTNTRLVAHFDMDALFHAYIDERNKVYGEKLGYDRTPEVPKEFIDRVVSENARIINSFFSLNEEVKVTMVRGAYINQPEEVHKVIINNADSYAREKVQETLNQDKPKTIDAVGNVINSFKEDLKQKYNFVIAEDHNVKTQYVNNGGFMTVVNGVRFDNQGNVSNYTYDTDKNMRVATVGKEQADSKYDVLELRAFNHNPLLYIDSDGRSEDVKEKITKEYLSLLLNKFEKDTKSNDKEDMLIAGINDIIKFDEFKVNKVNLDKLSRIVGELVKDETDQSKSTVVINELNSLKAGLPELAVKKIDGLINSK